MTSQPHELPPGDEINTHYRGMPTLGAVAPLSREERLANIKTQLEAHPGLVFRGGSLSRIVDMTYWELNTEYGPHGQTRVLTRDFPPHDKVELPESDQRRQVRRTERGIRMTVAEAVGADVLFMLKVDSTFGDNRPKTIFRKKGKEKPEPEAVIERSRFTPGQQQVLRYSTKQFTQLGMAFEADVTEKTVNSVFRDAKQRIGVSTNDEVILYAVGEGLASIDHLPTGKTDGLNEEQKEYLKKYFSQDESIKTKMQEIPLSDHGHMWQAIYEAIDFSSNTKKIHRKTVTMLYSIVDGLIELPKPPSSEVNKE